MTALVADITNSLAEVATISPFFAVSTNPAERADHTWHPLIELHTDSDVWSRRIAEVRQILGTDEDRVAASLAFQSLAARLVSAPLALAAVHGLVPVFSASTLHWRSTAAGPWPMWTPTPVAGRTADTPDEAGRLLMGLVVEPLLAPLTAAVCTASRVAAGLLWGNVASSLAGAAGVLAGAHAQARPDVRARARAIVAELLTASPLVGRGRYEPGGAFRRTSCCLYYRTPDGGLCGDCPFDVAPAGKS